MHAIVVEKRPSPTNTTGSAWSNHALSSNGLTKYIATRTISKGSSGTLNLSYWPLTDNDLYVVAGANSSKGIHTLLFRRCSKITDQGLSQLLVKCTLELRHLDLAGCRSLTDATCNVIAEYNPRLQSIDLSGCCQLSDQGLCALLRGCKHLEKIGLQNLPRLSNPTIDTIRTSVVMYNKLFAMDLSGCTNFTDEVLMKMLEDDCCGCIRDLDLSRCTQLKIGLVGLRRKGNITTNVRSLRLCHTSLVSDSTLGWLAKGCFHLLSLDLSGSSFPNSSLSYLFRGCKLLRELNLLDCVDLSDAALEPLSSSPDVAATCGARLASLNITGCSKITDKGIVSVALACPSLERIDLAGVPLITCKGLTTLARNCQYLKSVDISSDIQALSDDPRSRISRVPRVGSDGIKALGRYCKYLRVIRCNGASRIDASAIMEVAKGCQRLEVLTLRNCHRVTDECIEAIGLYCPLLRELDLGCCLRISDAAILALSRGGCTRTLESIDCTGLVALSDASMVPLAYKCSKLRSFIVRGCQQLSDAVVSALCSTSTGRSTTAKGDFIHPRQLQKLDMFGVKSISDRSLDRLMTCRMTLRTADFTGSQTSTDALKLFSRHMPHSILSQESRFHPRHKQATYNQYKDYLTFTFSQYDKIGSIIIGRVDRQRVLVQRMKIVQIQSVARGFLSRKLSEELHLLAEELREENKSSHVCVANDFSSSSCMYKIDGGDTPTDTPSAAKNSKEEAHTHSSLDSLHSTSEQMEAWKRNRRVPRAKSTANQVTNKITFSSADRVFVEMRSSWLLFRWRCFSFRLGHLQNIKSIPRFWAQRCIRMWWAKAKKRLDNERQNQAAARLQAVTSSFLRKKEAARVQELANLMDTSARIVQASWRNRIRYYELMEQVLNDEAMFRAVHDHRIRSAKSIQTHWRFQTAAKISQQAKAARDRLNLEGRAALRLQLCWRVHCAIRITSSRRTIIERWEILIHGKIRLYAKKAAASVQLRWRHEFWLKKRLKAALAIQNFVRCRKSHTILLLLKMERREASVRKIQGAYHSYRDRCGLFRLWRLYGKHILVIQRAYRSYRRHRAWQRAIRESHIQHYRKQNESKRQLLLKKHERKIMLLFSKRDDAAASLIQKTCRLHLEHTKATEAMRQLQVETDRVQATIEQKAQKDADETKRRKEDRLMNAMSWCHSSNSGRLIKYLSSFPFSLSRPRMILSTGAGINAAANAGTMPAPSPIADTTIGSAASHLTDEDFKCREWYDERIAMCQLTYMLDDEDIFELYDAYQDVDRAYGQDGNVYIEYLFHYIEEPMSTYGKWLFSAVNESPAPDVDFGETDHSAPSSIPTQICTCSFSAFVHTVCFIGMMGKKEQDHLLFSAVAESRSIDNNQKELVKVLTEARWEALILSMTEHEPIKCPIPMTVHKFWQYSHTNPSNTRERLAFFDDFVRLLETSPFLVFPLDRLQQKFQSKFLGCPFWANKRTRGGPM